MVLQLSSLHYDVISRAPSVVRPRPLPAQTPFYLPANWVQDIEMETRWLTDITRSKETLSEERRMLATRPVRSLSILLMTTTREETEAMALSYQRFCSFPPEQSVPFPLYCDLTYCEKNVETSGSQKIIWCDTTFRRLFLGQRVMLVHPQNSPSYVDGVAFCTVDAVYPDRLIVSGLADNFPIGSVVYPCLDASLVFNIPADMETATVAQVTVSVEEAFGMSQLPGLWDHPLSGIFPSERQPWRFANYRPFCRFDANWRGKVGVSISSSGTEETVGKGKIFDVYGSRPLHDISFELLDGSRESAWQARRIFDGLRGRGGTLFIPSLRDSWQVLAIDPLYVRISTTRPASEIEAFVDFIYLQFKPAAMPNAVVYPEVREVATVNQISVGVVEIGWSEALVGYGDLTVQNVEVCEQALLCHFKRDSFLEAWVTDSVCKAKIELVEVLDEGNKTVANLPVYSPSSGRPDQISDLQFWFSSKNSFSFAEYDFFNSLHRAFSHPHEHSSAHMIFDARASLPDVFPIDDLSIPEIHLKEYEVSTNTAFVQQARDANKNKGQKPILNPSFNFSLHDNTAPKNGKLTNLHKSIWSPTAGWTLFVVLTGGLLPYQNENAVLLHVKDDLGTFLFLWKCRNRAAADTQGEIQLCDSPGSTNPNHRIVHPSVEQGMPLILILTWAPGFSANFWMRGSRNISSPADKWITPSSLSTLAMPSALRTFARASWFGPALNYPLPKQSGVVDANWQQLNMLNACLSYKRNLGISEINDVGSFLANLYGIVWRDVS